MVKYADQPAVIASRLSLTQRFTLVYRQLFGPIPVFQRALAAISRLATYGKSISAFGVAAGAKAKACFARER